MSDQGSEELLIRILVSGAKEARKELSSVRSDVRSFGQMLKRLGLSTGGFLAFKKIAQDAGDFGLSMSLLSTRTGIATQTFQKFAYAGEMVGIKSEETMATLSSLQKQMDQFSIKGEGPEWINELAANTNLDYDRIRDTVYMFRKLQQYATDPRINGMRKRLVLESFGLSDRMIAALMKGSFNLRSMNQTNFLSNQHIGDLKEMGGEWHKFTANFSNVVNKFAAVFMSRPVTDFLKGLNSFTDSFSKWLDDADSVFGDIGEEFDSWWTATFNDPTGQEKAKRKTKNAAQLIYDGQILRESDFEFTVTEDQVNAYKRRQALLRRNPEYWKKRRELEARGRSFDVDKVGMDVVRGTNAGTDATGMEFARRYKEARGKSYWYNERQWAADVSNARAASGNAGRANAKVTVNQTNNFTNSRDNPQQIRQAAQDGVKAGIDGMQAQINKAAMGTSYAVTGS